MGLSPFSDSRKRKPVAPEPDPKRFTIKKVRKIWLYSVCYVHYPGCTTYKGMKTLVYNATPAQVKAAHTLDPHFSASNKLAPIARFPGNAYGWKCAILFAQALEQHECLHV